MVLKQTPDEATSMKESMSAALYAVLQPRATDGERAVRMVDALFDAVIARLHKDPRCALNAFELELILADLRADCLPRIFNLSHGLLDLTDTVDVVACRFFGED
jgi:hypothetical protein